MITNLVDMFFGCWHKNYSFPITSKPGKPRSHAAAITGTYVVCLDCGKEFAYDWQQMKVVSTHPRQLEINHAVPEEARAEAA